MFDYMNYKVYMSVSIIPLVTIFSLLFAVIIKKVYPPLLKTTDVSVNNCDNKC